MPPAASVFAELIHHGLLLLNDPDLPNLCALIVGERVRGSWWVHPRSQEIFAVYDAMEDHPDVLIMKLISGKVTYVHRSLWPQVVAVGCARDHWQMEGLSAAARKLLADVDRAPVEPDAPCAKRLPNLRPEFCYTAHNSIVSRERMCGALSRGGIGPDAWIFHTTAYAAPVPALFWKGYWRS